MQTQTIPSANLTFAPVTPPVARLLHKLQAELLKAEPTAPAIQPGAIVLSGAPAHASFVLDGTGLVMTSTDGRPQQSFYREYDGVHAGRWWSHESRLDDLGRRWSRNCADYTIDDFGYLVEVPA